MAFWNRLRSRRVFSSSRPFRRVLLAEPLEGRFVLSPTIIATIPVGSNPNGIAADPTSDRLYVANSASNTVSVLHGTSHTVVATIPVGSTPVAVGVNTNTHRVYVVNQGSAQADSVSVIDGAPGSPTQNTVIATITVPGHDFDHGRGIAVDSVTNQVFVPSFDPGGVVVRIDGGSNSVAGLIPVAANPLAATVDPVSHKVYIGHGSFFGRTRVTIIDGFNYAVSDGPEVGLAQTGLAVDADAHRLYVRKGDPSRGSPYGVAVVDTTTNAVLTTVDAGVGQGNAAFNPTASRLYTSAHTSQNLFVVDTRSGSPSENQVVGNLDLGGLPGGLAVNLPSGLVYVSKTSANAVLVIEDRDGPPPPPVGLTNWWPGNGNTRDIIGRRDATLQGSTVLGPAYVCDGFVHDGGGHVNVVHDASLNLGTADWTLSFWAKFDTLAGEQVLVEKYVETFGASRTGWTFTKLETNQLRLALGGLGDVDTAPLNLPTNTWLHYAVRRSGLNFSIFNNGALLASGSFANNLDSPASLKFGHRGSPSDTPGSADTRGFFLKGTIDEVELYRGRALSNAEVDSIRLAGSQGHTVNVVTSAATMLENRGLDYEFTLTTLADGRVLAVGGTNTVGSRASAEIFDPSANTWTMTGSLNVARRGHSATLLPSGKVLVAGGVGNDPGQLNSAELFDPETGTWTTTGSFADARDNHTAILLGNGKVLIAAGSHPGPGDTFGLASAELYDPATGTWTPTGSLNVARMNHRGVLLQDGRVLVAGGQDRGVTFANFASAEIYNPATGMWTPADDMPVARRGNFSLTTLHDGRVLVAGGWTSWTASTTDGAELFDPNTGHWTPASPLPGPRNGHAATVLPDSNVLVTAGNNGAFLTSALIFNPVAQTWTPTANSLASIRANHRQVRLDDGSVLAVGGNTGPFSVATAERYGPPNYAPRARAGGPYTVAESGSVVLDGRGSSDPDQPSNTLSYVWDLDNDGIFGETGAAATRGNETGPTPTYSAANLNGPLFETVTLRVRDACGLVNVHSATVEIVNVAPVVTSFANSSPNIGGAVEGQAISVNGSFADAGLLDTHTAVIDWGDGTTSDANINEANGSGTLAAQHVYTNGGLYRITTVVTDDQDSDDEATGATIAGAGVQDGVLVVIGTSRADHIQVSQSGGPFQLHGSFLPTGTKTLSSAGVSRVVVRLGGGDDQAILAAVTLPTQIDGGAGKDVLQGSTTAANILLGGAGNDTLVGGAARDLIFGGTGADYLYGNGDEDLLIGGTTSYDGDDTALALLRAEWTRTDKTYAQRVGNLTNGGGLNGSLKLTNQSVFDDAAVDRFSGGIGTDWFFANVTGLVRDVLVDRVPAEGLVDIS